MNEFNEHQMDEGLEDVTRRLRADRPQASDLELDRVKVQAISRASRTTAGRKRGLRPRIVSTLVAAALLALGAIGIGASSGGIPSVSFTNSDSTSSQYCPPSSQSGGKPKNSANKCGQPKTKP